MSLRVFICADIEGTSGYVDSHEDEDDRPRVRRAMTADVNAAVEGVLDADGSASVVVADSHGSKRNVLHEDLHPAASLVRGGPREGGMVAGVEAGADLAFLVGMHDRPGSGGVLEHTFTGTLADVRLDGTPVGEVELDALLADHYGVPVALVTGDDRLRETVSATLPAARYVTTKRARGIAAATCRHPDRVRADVREAASAAISEGVDDAPVRVDAESPFEVTVRFVDAKLADTATLWPAVRRGEESREVVYDAPDIAEAYRFVRATTTVSP